MRYLEAYVPPILDPGCARSAAGDAHSVSFIPLRVGDVVRGSDRIIEAARALPGL